MNTLLGFADYAEYGGNGGDYAVNSNYPEPVIALYPLPVRIAIAAALASLTWAALIGAASMVLG